MRIQNWPADRPIPYARNPRTIPQRAIDKLAASITAGDPQLEYREQYARARSRVSDINIS